ncbi:hypothetical protein SASPL_135672 [Salvia splendens]|uniref:Protein kinase domain-containing protein n=1 Tax=Salvia splendens TaxID=180675 RepID=A0A8X8WYK6_SALSN|nr:hypothetical protein SASPL_135672 [Salvia splendens]
MVYLLETTHQQWQTSARNSNGRPGIPSRTSAIRPTRIRNWVEDVAGEVRHYGPISEAAAMARAANASVYSADLLSTKYGSRPIRVAQRALEIFASLGSFAFNLWLDQLRCHLDQNQRQRAVNLRNTLTKLGPTFVKIGQGLSTRPDLCPPLYIEELSQLQDALPTFPDAEAFSCIERELGCSLDSVYSSISASPIAAASLGQVYKARLSYSSQVVAVKVQRPGIEEAIGLDFYLIRGLGFLINKYVDFVTSDVVALIDEFARREGQNARRFKKLYADKADVLVPDIFWDYTSGKVLTMEWVEGVKLSEHEAIERQGLKVLDLVNTGIQCSLRQLLEYGYFHADPHPGNLLATPDGKLAFLDFGMMSETPEQARSAIIGHVVHMVNRDYEAMARDYYALDFLPPDVDVAPIVPALRNFFDDALNSTVSELNFKTIVDGLGAVLYQYPFNVPAYYALILRSLTVLEGLALYADPNFKVLAASYPYFAKRLLTDPNPYLRDALIELLFKDGRFRHVGRKDRDFNAKDALQPVLKLLLGPDGEVLRNLVIKEAIQVTEADVEKYVNILLLEERCLAMLNLNFVVSLSCNSPLEDISYYMGSCAARTRSKATCEETLCRFILYSSVLCSKISMEKNFHTVLHFLHIKFDILLCFNQKQALLKILWNLMVIDIYAQEKQRQFPRICTNRRGFIESRLVKSTLRELQE